MISRSEPILMCGVAEGYFTLVGAHRMRDKCPTKIAHAMRSYNDRYSVQGLFNKVVTKAQQVQVHAVIRVFDTKI